MNAFVNTLEMRNILSTRNTFIDTLCVDKGVKYP